MFPCCAGGSLTRAVEELAFTSSELSDAELVSAPYCKDEIVL